MSGDTHGPAREAPGIASRPVLMAAFGFLALVVAALVVLHLLYRLMVPSPPDVAPRTFPAPGLSLAPADELRAVQEEQRARLQGYAWVDKDRGVLRIPIDRAMDMVVARGSAAYDPLERPAPAPPAGQEAPP